MATYKIPQDVEAEDKLLGPLTFKQFIFMLIAAGAGLISWALFQASVFLGFLPFPIILIFGGLAVFRREDQPVERYLLSFFNYTLRPRQRVWDPEGFYDHLVITPEKKPTPPPLKQDLAQVHGQLERLAQVVDTRGWATKRPDLVTPQGNISQAQDDRLFMPEQPAAAEEVPENEDIMDDSNPKNQQINTMLQKSTEDQREKLLQEVREAIDKGEEIGATATPKHEKNITPPSQQDQAQPQQADNGHATESQANQDTANTQEEQEQMQKGSAILETLPTEDLSVSQVAAAANRRSDQEIQEGEEIRLR